MRIAVGFDHRGVLIRDAVLAELGADGHTVIDCGTDNSDPVDYPDIAEAVGRKIQAHEADRGIIVCGSGAGAVIAANKLRGVRAVMGHDTYTARQGVEHDDANVLALGSGIVGVEVAREAVQAFLGARFLPEERYVRRLRKVEALEADSAAHTPAS